MSDVRLTTDGGLVLDDPDETTIRTVLGSVADGSEAFVLLERTSDASGGTFAQAASAGDGTLVVEHRSDAGHLQAVVDLGTAAQVLAGWVAGSPRFGDGVSWTPA